VRDLCYDGRSNMSKGSSVVSEKERNATFGEGAVDDGGNRQNWKGRYMDRKITRFTINKH
jgi:hypothetical protein